jgi:protein tyrosine phosphatase
MLEGFSSITFLEEEDSFRRTQHSLHHGTHSGKEYEMSVEVIAFPWEGIFRMEFQTINKLSSRSSVAYPMTTLKFDVNTFKNRYPSVLPTSATRVQLLHQDGVEGSDYINANFINGEVDNSFRYYIAAQAPLESTTTDFWRMIWEQVCT